VTVRTLGKAYGVPLASRIGLSMSRKLAVGFFFATDSTAFSSMNPTPATSFASSSTRS
jgi:hypothetical protein